MKNDISYYRNMIKLYDRISTQRSIPKEIIIPMYEYLFEIGLTIQEIHLNLLFEICFDLSKDFSIQSLEDLDEWFNQGNHMVVEEDDIIWVTKKPFNGQM